MRSRHLLGSICTYIILHSPLYLSMQYINIVLKHKYFSFDIRVLSKYFKVLSLRNSDDCVHMSLYHRKCTYFFSFGDEFQTGSGPNGPGIGHDDEEATGLEQNSS